MTIFKQEFSSYEKITVFFMILIFYIVAFIIVCKNISNQKHKMLASDQIFYHLWDGLR